MMIVLIPAYKPDQRLVDLIDALCKIGCYRIVVVNDGSGAEYEPIFDQVRSRGATVLVHEVNQGKGRALKTGFSYAMTQDCRGVVTADADGQHLPKDIDAVAQKLLDCDEKTFVIGSRGFGKDTPLRSRLGNCITRAVFLMASGNRVCDTQTGLRAFPTGMLSWLTQIGGDRYEYEMEVLLASARAGYRAQQVQIDTVYFDENKGSHFSTVRDAARVYWVISRYCPGAVVGSVLEWVLFCVLFAVDLPWALPVKGLFCFLASRLASLIVKYGVFRQKPVRYEIPALIVRTVFGALLLVFAVTWPVPIPLTKWIVSVIPLALTLVVYNKLAKRFD